MCVYAGNMIKKCKQTCDKHVTYKVTLKHVIKLQSFYCHNHVKSGWFMKNLTFIPMWNNCYLLTVSGICANEDIVQRVEQPTLSSGMFSVTAFWNSRSKQSNRFDSVLNIVKDIKDTNTYICYVRNTYTKCLYMYAIIHCI